MKKIKRYSSSSASREGTKGPLESSLGLASAVRKIHFGSADDDAASLIQSIMPLLQSFSSSSSVDKFIVVRVFLRAGETIADRPKNGTSKIRCRTMKIRRCLVGYACAQIIAALTPSSVDASFHEFTLPPTLFTS